MKKSVFSAMTFASILAMALTGCAQVIHGAVKPTPTTSGGTPTSTGTAVTLPSSVTCDKSSPPPPTPTPVGTPWEPCWVPAAANAGGPSRWQYVLSVSPPDYTVDAPVFDIDLFDNLDNQPSGQPIRPAHSLAVDKLHGLGKKVICYIDAGTWENWRPDASQYPPAVLGASNGWAGEKWVDIRQLNVLQPIIKNRIQLCKEAGFDSVELDNMDGYTNKTGFPLTANDQLLFNETLANDAHAVGLSVAQKNDVEQTAQLSSYFDYAINEQCFQYSECGALQINYSNKGRAVFEVEYKLATSKFCTKARNAGFAAIKKKLALDNTVEFCPLPSVTPTPTTPTPVTPTFTPTTPTSTSAP